MTTVLGLFPAAALLPVAVVAWAHLGLAVRARAEAGGWPVDRFLGPRRDAGGRVLSGWVYLMVPVWLALQARAPGLALLALGLGALVGEAAAAAAGRAAAALWRGTGFVLAAAAVAGLARFGGVL